MEINLGTRRQVLFYEYPLGYQPTTGISFKNKENVVMWAQEPTRDMFGQDFILKKVDAACFKILLLGNIILDMPDRASDQIRTGLEEVASRVADWGMTEKITISFNMTKPPTEGILLSTAVLKRTERTFPITATREQVKVPYEVYTKERFAIAEKIIVQTNKWIEQKKQAQQRIDSHQSELVKAMDALIEAEFMMTRKVGIQDELAKLTWQWDIDGDTMIMISPELLAKAADKVVYLGKIEFTITLSTGYIKCKNLIMTSGSYPHPHAVLDGGICFGSLSKHITKAIRSFEMKVVEDLLSTWCVKLPMTSQHHNALLFPRFVNNKITYAKSDDIRWISNPSYQKEML